MLKITCFGGVGEIGGNKIMLEEGGSRLLLDFGKTFSGEGRFFDEFLQPRTNSCLRDLLTLKLLPEIPGIYRTDLLRHAGAWDEIAADGEIPESARRLYVSDLPGYDEYGAGVDGILLSHGHADHCQYLCFIDPRIPVYCTQTTYTLMKAAEEVGKGGYESDIIECPPRKCSRTKSGTFPGALKVEKDDGDWTRKLEIVSPDRHFQIGAFTAEAIPVDHSVPGACSYLITSPSGKRIFYTGDIRFNGRFSCDPTNLTAQLRERTKDLRPDVLISEGTRITSERGGDEKSVEDDIVRIIDACSGLAMIEFGWKDTTRFQTVLEAARSTGRTLVINPKLAYLWALLHQDDPNDYPELSSLGNVAVYLKRCESMTYSPADYSKAKHLAGICCDWGANSQQMAQAYAQNNMAYLQPRLCHYNDGIRAYDISARPKDYILHIGYFEMNELLDINPSDGSCFIRAVAEPFCDEMEIDERKLINWLDAFGVRYEKKERSDGGIGIATNHISGHASGPDLLEFIIDLCPHRVIPVHTEDPDTFVRELDSTEVIVPRLGEAIDVL